MSEGGQIINPGALLPNGLGPEFEGGNAAFFKSLVVTLYYALGTVPAEILIGLVFAYLLYQNINGKRNIQDDFFLPYVTLGYHSSGFQIILVTEKRISQIRC